MSDQAENKPFTPPDWAKKELERIKQEAEALRIVGWLGVSDADAAWT